MLYINDKLFKVNMQHKPVIILKPNNLKFKNLKKQFQEKSWQMILIFFFLLFFHFYFCTDPPFILVCRYDWIKQLFVQQADQFSSRPVQSWLLNQVIKGKGKLGCPTRVRGRVTELGGICPFLKKLLLEFKGLALGKMPSTQGVKVFSPSWYGQITWDFQTGPFTDLQPLNQRYCCSLNNLSSKIDG